MVSSLLQLPPRTTCRGWFILGTIIEILLEWWELWEILGKG